MQVLSIMRIRVFLLLALVFLTMSCQKDHAVDKDSSLLVVEGWIEDGEFPVVMLTKSLSVSDEYGDIAFDSKDYLVRWAKVTVSDGQKSVVLTGKYDARYLPPYIYTTSWLRGEAGKSYWLTVECDEARATAVTTIPQPVPVDSFKISKVEKSDTLYQITAGFVDNPSQRNFYQFFVRTGTQSRQYGASYLGSVSDDVLTGYAEIPVYQAHRLQKEAYTPYFTVHDTVSVKFAQVDETSFNFWDDYTKNQSISSNLFLSPTLPIRTNILGGIGYWCGYGSTNYYFVIRDYAE